MSIEITVGANIVRAPRRAAIRMMGMMVMQMRPSHSDTTGRRRSMGCTHGGPIGWNHVRSGPARTQRWLGCRHLLPGVDFRHAPNPSASQPRILVAVSPTVHGPLDQAPFSPQTWIQIRQSPSDRVALGFVAESIAAVLVFGAAGSRINAIFGLELGRQMVHIDRFHITSDRVFHLHPISRILKRDPLHTIIVLAHHQRRGCGNRSWGCIRIRSASAGRAGMQRSAIALRNAGRVMGRADRTRGRPLQRRWIERSLHHRRLHFGPRTVRHAGWMPRLLRGRRRRMLHRRRSLLM